ncbi:lysophospholipid acyltransferase family protein [Conexibacter woesei]|uniref:Phospholipid/glycerol acyltransferase n=1 Tax=Conexibacter woesei (strain DSM 14684 / CCUG 47730 / CIP 108061 / JCM 11494 / NBRC 100937 / ID131577) TaxID=469383 RepID=D3FDV3_CONWI|nr:lysophospholipid acyltransferase family protein [Conexibacter woesei]ADB51569.1 phospholipid/glycerol acyltransferase [Conexibacter woesei DSM 14684]
MAGASSDRADLDQPWARALPARAARELIVCGLFNAIIRAYARTEVTGREQLRRLDGPAIFVANHCSHADTPVLLRALPRRLRRRTAVAAAADYFYTGRLLASAVSLAFCTVPLERRAGGRGIGSTAALEPLIDARWSLVVFAEGTRSRDGRVGPLLAGAAALAVEHGLPLVPVHIAGTHAAMPAGRRWMTRPAGRRLARHALRVSFGGPLRVAPGEDRFEVMERVRLFMEECGAQTTPDPKLAARRAAAAAAAETARVAQGRSA